MTKQMMMRPTTMGLAMANAASKLMNHNRVSAKIIDNARTQVHGVAGGAFCVKEPEWNAHLKFKTAEELKAAGIL